MKRTPLNRRQQTAVDYARQLRRTPMSTKPTKRALEKRDAMHAARVLLSVRDGWTCRLRYAANPTCFGPLDPHHLKKASAGGTEAIEGLVWLCRTHNTAVEDHPDRAHALGLVVRFGDTLEDAWTRMHAAGLAERPEPSPVPQPVLPSGICDLCGVEDGMSFVGDNGFCADCSTERFG